MDNICLVKNCTKFKNSNSTRCYDCANNEKLCLFPTCNQNRLNKNYLTCKLHIYPTKIYYDNYT
jgi:hypothetical protein